MSTSISQLIFKNKIIHKAFGKKGRWFLNVITIKDVNIKIRTRNVHSTFAIVVIKGGSSPKFETEGKK